MADWVSYRKRKMPHVVVQAIRIDVDSIDEIGIFPECAEAGTFCPVGKVDAEARVVALYGGGVYGTGDWCVIRDNGQVIFYKDAMFREFFEKRARN